MKRWLTWCGVGLAALVLVVLPGWIALGSRDAETVDETGLTIAWPELAPGEDALPLIEEAGDTLVWPEDGEGQKSLCAVADLDLDLAREVVAANAATLASLERAVAIGRLQLPPAYHDVAWEEGVDRILGWQRLAKLLRLRGLTRLADGDAPGALRDLELALDFGHMLEAARGSTLLTMMMAVSAKSIALAGVRHAAPRAGLSAADARDLALRLDARRPDPGAWERMWAGEWQTVKNGPFAQLAPENRVTNVLDAPEWLGPLIPDSYLYHHNRTLGRMADRYRGLARDTHRLCSELTSIAVAPTASEKLAGLLSPNPVGTILTWIAMPNHQRFQMRRCQLDTHVSATQAAAALAVWRRQQGALPDSLGALVPDYLAHVPRDGFTGGPLRYDRDGAFVYAVGADLVDAGGGRPDGKDLDEPTYAVGL